MSNSKKRFQKLLCASLALSNLGFTPVHAADGKPHSGSLKPFLIGLGSTVLGSATIAAIVLGVKHYKDAQRKLEPSPSPINNPGGNELPPNSVADPQRSENPIHNIPVPPIVPPNSTNLPDNSDKFYCCDDGLQITKDIVENDIDKINVEMEYGSVDDEGINSIQPLFLELCNEFGVTEGERVGCGKLSDEDRRNLGNFVHEAETSTDLLGWSMAPYNYVFGPCTILGAPHYNVIRNSYMSVDSVSTFVKCVRFAYSKMNDSYWRPFILNFLKQFARHGGHCPERFTTLIYAGKRQLDRGFRSNSVSTLAILTNIKNELYDEGKKTACDDEGAAKAEVNYFGNLAGSWIRYNLGLQSGQPHNGFGNMMNLDRLPVVLGKVLNHTKFIEISNRHFIENETHQNFVQSKAENLHITFENYCKYLRVTDDEKRNMVEAMNDCDLQASFKEWVNGKNTSIDLYNAQICIGSLYGINGVPDNLCSNTFGNLFTVECFNERYLK